MAGGRMGAGEILGVAAQTTSALAAAHATGMVHRDIKPEDVMVRTDGYVKVLDFGIAKFTSRVSAGTETLPVLEALKRFANSADR